MRPAIAAILCFGALVAVLGAAGCDSGGGGGAQASTSDEIVIPPELQDLNVIDYHLDITGGSDSGLCVDCHGDMNGRVTKDPEVKEFHAFKHQFGDCTSCHEKVDLMNKSGGSLRKQVDVVRKCRPCHDADGPGPQLYQ